MMSEICAIEYVLLNCYGKYNHHHPLYLNFAWAHCSKLFILFTSILINNQLFNSSSYIWKQINNNNKENAEKYKYIRSMQRAYKIVG
jgi:hypothetical protein